VLWIVEVHALAGSRGQRGYDILTCRAANVAVVIVLNLEARTTAVIPSTPARGPCEASSCSSFFSFNQIHTRLEDDVSAAHESFARRPCRRHCSIRRPAVSLDRSLVNSRVAWSPAAARYGPAEAPVARRRATTCQCRLARPIRAVPCCAAHAPPRWRDRSRRRLSP